MSISGATRRNPRRMRPSRSASAWNLTRMTRALQFRDQFRVGFSRLLVLRLSSTLLFPKICIDFVLIPQVVCERAVHLFESQSRITFNHALGRHPLAEQIHEGVEGDASVSHTICT